MCSTGAGFLKVLDDNKLGFADFRVIGSTSASAMSGHRPCRTHADGLPEPPASEIYARAELRELKDDTDLARRLASPGYKARVERAVLVRHELPQHITPRFTEPELEQALEPVRWRILDLENETMALRAASSGQRDESGVAED